ncbi:hypothetical protein [Clostridium sp.]|uniref:hypothetical protein n=1 Tax=Clostridium sp. TaxID=1506 RepID=UPI003216A9DC
MYRDIKITKREIIASISIIAIMLIIGVMISQRITQNHVDKMSEYNKALHINKQDVFEYAMNTNIGNSLVYGDIKSIDTVSYSSEVDGEYSFIEKVKERYTMHTRTVTKTRTVNGKVQTYTDTETYWTWDEIGREEKKCSGFILLGNEFGYSQILNPESFRQHIDTKKESSNIRYVYNGSPTEFKGTVYCNLKKGSLSKIGFYNKMNIEQVLKELDKDTWNIVFWIMWILLTIAIVIGFYYLENRWLD